MTYFPFIPRQAFFYGKRAKVPKKVAYETKFSRMITSDLSQRITALVDKDFDSYNDNRSGMEKRIASKGTIWNDNTS